MNCHHCGQESEPGNNFCPACGARLQLSCPSCQTPYTPGSQFCSRCGRSLAWAGSPPPGTTPAGPPPTFPCPRCHQVNTPQADYCFACGMPFDDARPLPPPFEFSLSHPGAPWRRLLAAFIDGIAVAAVSFIIFVLTSSFFIRALFSWGPYLLFLLLPFLMLLPIYAAYAVYTTVSIAIWSTTPGKRAFGLYVVRTDGSKVSAGMALARSLAAVVSALTVIGIILIVFRQDKRGLHDLICDTVVIHRRR